MNLILHPKRAGQTMTRIPFALLLLLIAAGCQKQGDRDEELLYLRAALPAELLEQSHLDIPSRDCIAKLETPEGTSLGLRIFPGQSKSHGGIRAEISLDYPFQPEEVVRYSWRFQLPEDFVSDAPQNRWWVIGQWHDQPDSTKNETWDTHPSYSPPISLSIAEVNQNLLLGISYGITHGGHEQAHPAPIPIQRGNWYTVHADIHWSLTEQGRAKISLREVTDSDRVMTGPNMNNAYQHYLKIGMYRHPAIQSENWIHLDQITATHLTKEPRENETGFRGESKPLSASPETDAGRPHARKK
ncbi:putative signal peptide protein [Rhodopirellula islandica]|uniref:Signal peptide protein n=2 Tax=Rhodopirellula islandica TaxID=595434 RepID=A0A0J1BCY5_RHOIS|nr:putative signal peptide protein [Rhodopirellula islandica]